MKWLRRVFLICDIYFFLLVHLVFQTLKKEKQFLLILIFISMNNKVTLIKINKYDVDDDYYYYYY